MINYKYEYVIPVKDAEGNFAGLRIEESYINQSSIEIDCLLALTPTLVIEDRVDVLLGSPPFDWDDEECCLIQDSKSLIRLKCDYSTSVLSIAIGALKSEGLVLILLDTLTVMCDWEVHPENGEEPYILIQPMRL
jgi:hypothetical protein|tara:strand:+ start:533 stop:937 length:405 start_codon:yes stop_codon:yes gene_type:complete